MNILEQNTFFSDETIFVELCFALKQSDNGFTASKIFISNMTPTF